MGAEFSFCMKFIETHARAFLALIILGIGTVIYMFPIFFHAAKSLIIYVFFPGGNFRNCIHFTAEAAWSRPRPTASRGQPPSRYVLAVHRWRRRQAVHTVWLFATTYTGFSYWDWRIVLSVTGYSFWDRLLNLFIHLHELFFQFISWTNLVNSGKFIIKYYVKLWLIWKRFTTIS